MIDVYNPETPQAFARKLVKAPHSNSTIQTMVYNRFGHRLAAEFIDELREKENHNPFARTSKEWNVPLEAGTQAHHSSMAQFSNALLRRIWCQHRPIMQYLASAGRQVVKP